MKHKPSTMTDYDEEHQIKAGHTATKYMANTHTVNKINKRHLTISLQLFHKGNYTRQGLT